ncbi:MAG: response regulator transcription factor [Trueperaceae bacterium]|nr:response regulator transcription factor [Trueperaceae bacterium]
MSQRGAPPENGTRPRLLLIEDDADIARLLALELAEAGFELEHHDRGTHGLTALRERRPDLVILDLGLPDMDGAEIARRIRRTDTVPILVLTAADELGRKVRLLEDGADDYLVKPFQVEELIARIRVQLRSRGADTVVRFGALTIDRMAREVRHEETEVLLSPREFDLLVLLVTQPGRVFARQEIERRVWGDREGPTSNSVDVHVANLRSKLRDAGAPGLIRTVRGVGYAVKSPA